MNLFWLQAFTKTSTVAIARMSTVMRSCDPPHDPGEDEAADGWAYLENLRCEDATMVVKN